SPKATPWEARSPPLPSHLPTTAYRKDCWDEPKNRPPPVRRHPSKDVPHRDPRQTRWELPDIPTRHVPPVSDTVRTWVAAPTHAGSRASSPTGKDSTRFLRTHWQP